MPSPEDILAASRERYARRIAADPEFAECRRQTSLASYYRRKAARAAAGHVPRPVGRPRKGFGPGLAPAAENASPL